jgi:2-phosphosulfolactate phosphatase
MRIETVLTPAEISCLQVHEDEVCVVFDILRATTSIVTAIASGATRVFAVTTIEEARALHTEIPDALLAGERGGDPIPGFDLGNSPQEFTHCAGRTLITTTTNGTIALAAARPARATCAACFLNLNATAAWILKQNPGTVRLLCAGTHSDFAFEDGLAAGAFADILGGEDIGDATAAMRDLYRHHHSDWADIVRCFGNGRVLVEAGRSHDIDWAMRMDVFDAVVVRSGRAFVSGDDQRRPMAEF